MKTWFLRHSMTLRRITQLSVLLFLMAVPFLNHRGYHAIVGTLYSIDVFGLTIVDPAMLLQVFVLGELFPWVLLLSALIPLILAMVAGRVFCSWMCPYNLLAETLYRLKKRLIPGRVVRVQNPPILRTGISLVVVFTTVAVTGLPLVVFLSMPGLISAEIARLISGEGLGLALAIPAILLIVDTFLIRRAWCKSLCPVGGILALVSTRRSLRVHVEKKLCASCDVPKENLCKKVCPLDLDPRSEKDLYPGCYNCLDCVSTCQKHGGALTVRGLNSKTHV